MKHVSRLCLIAVAGCAAVANGQMHTDTFEFGTNMGHWTLSGEKERIEYWSGYNGAYFRSFVRGVPTFRTQGPSVFTGDWSTRNSTIFCFAMGVYLQAGPAAPLTLVLSTNNGTPSDPTDDWAAWYDPGSQFAPEVGEPWKYISYFIPTLDQAEAPEGWQLMNLGPNAPTVRDWRVLLRNISEVKVIFGHPGSPPAGGLWIVGVDDVRVEPIMTEAPCYPNCDGSTNPPILNPNDFQCFLHSFAAGCGPTPPCYANCDGSTASPLLTANDFQCYMIKFAAGCS